jgi:hypothetical protein
MSIHIIIPADNLALRAAASAAQRAVAHPLRDVRAGPHSAVAIDALVPPSGKIARHPSRQFRAYSPRLFRIYMVRRGRADGDDVVPRTRGTSEASDMVT